MEGTVKRDFDSIDLLKFIMCILVVAIHSDPFNDISSLFSRLVLGIGRLCVPIFFIASAFFLFRNNFGRDKIVKYINRLFLLYFAWFIISLPITIFNRFSQNIPFATKLFLFIKSFFFTSTFSGSWFLMSSIFSALLVYFVYNKFHKNAKSLLLIVSVIIYILCVFSSAWGNLMDITGIRPFYDKFVFWFAKPYTSILVGVPYFFVGKYIADNEEKIVTPKWYYIALLLALLLFEVYFTYVYKLCNSSDCYLLLLPCAYCIFVFFLKKDWQINMSVWMRKTSTIVFFSQFIWLFLIEFSEWYFKVRIFNFFKFVIALLLCVITATLMFRLQKKNKFKWLRYFY